MASFTSKFINSIKPPQKGRQEFYDDSLTGFMLRVTSKGAMTWSVRYTVRGGDKGQLRYTIGTHPSVSLADARERARKIIEAAQQGVDLIEQEENQKREDEEKRKASAGLTTAKVAGEYLTDYRAHRRKNSIDSCKYELRYIQEEFGEKAVTEIRRRDIENLCQRLSRDHPATANRVWARMRAFLSWAVSKEILEVNVCASVTKKTLQRSLVLHKESPRERVLTDDELRKVLLVCDALGYPGGWYVKLLLLTGTRRDETLKMPWSEIADLDRGDWIIPSDRYKTHTPHLIPLPRQAVELLRKIQAVAGSPLPPYVFESRHKDDSPYSSKWRIRKRISDRAGVAEWTLHDLRRTVRSGLSRIGVERDTAERVIGHAVGTSLDRVYDLYDYRKEKAAALQKWADHLDELTIPAQLKKAS